MSKFQVGHLTNFETDDPLFDTREDAEKHAQQEFPLSDFPVGLWRFDGGELLGIWYQGEWYT